jgi:hypothetical protein
MEYLLSPEERAFMLVYNAEAQRIKHGAEGAIRLLMQQNGMAGMDVTLSEDCAKLSTNAKPATGIPTGN